MQASERQLPPLQKEWTVRELLMESIKKPPNLRSSRNRYVPKSERISPQCGELLFHIYILNDNFLHVILFCEIYRLCLCTTLFVYLINS